MLWRYLKAQIWVLLCGGLVGPIFLTVYFAAGKDPLMKWMFWVGLVVTAIDVLLALLWAGYGARAAARSQYLEQRGVLGTARVIGRHETGTEINGQPLIKLDLRIEGPGFAPFTAEDQVIASVPRLPSITGGNLVVLVDPDTQRFEIDWNRAALVNGVTPAQFILDEDGSTYDLTGQAGPLMEIMQALKSNNVPLTGTIDIRSNPVLRQQVMNIVRRATTGPVSPEPAPSYRPAAPAPSTAARLQELETLRATGVITEAEYRTKRERIIAEL
ncbi:MAG: SHOCT domain-containing protein [Mycobacterium sp.]